MILSGQHTQRGNEMYQVIKHSNNKRTWLVINEKTNHLDSIKDTKKEAKQRAEELNK